MGTRVALRSFNLGRFEFLEEKVLKWTCPYIKLDHWKSRKTCTYQPNDKWRRNGTQSPCSGRRTKPHISVIKRTFIHSSCNSCRLFVINPKFYCIYSYCTMQYNVESFRYWFSQIVKFSLFSFPTSLVLRRGCISSVKSGKKGPRGLKVGWVQFFRVQQAHNSMGTPFQPRSGA